MDYSEIVKALKNASLFDLYRLQVAIDHQLEDPKRIEPIKRCLKPGQTISYFDSRINGLVEAVVIRIKRTRLLVENNNDHRRWNIPFYLINLDNVDTDIRIGGEGIAKEQLKVGDRVGFLDRQNQELYGVVVKLNPKTATILVDNDIEWRVAYRWLFSVIDSERGHDRSVLQGQVLSREYSDSISDRDKG